MDVLQQVFEFIDKAGTIGLAIGVAYGLWKRHIVLGWVYGECEMRLQNLDVLLNAHAAKMEAKIERLEAERDKRYERPS